MRSCLRRCLNSSGPLPLWSRTVWVAAFVVAGLAGQLRAQPAPPPPLLPVAPAVNPFADEDKQPEPLRASGGSRPKVQLELRQKEFDGADLIQMYIVGPNFEWMCEPFFDWGSVPTAADESLALAYRPNQRVRLSFAFYRPREFLPDLTPSSLIGYLALMRARDPKNFVLLTPIDPDAPSINGTSFGGFLVQYVDYAFKQGDKDYTLHRDYFFDLNKEYYMLVRLSGPRAFVEYLNPSVYFHLGRSAARKGLGVKAGAASADEKVVTPEEALATARAAAGAPPAASPPPPAPSGGR